MIDTNVNSNEKESKAQEALILRALQNGERLTALDALNRFGCLRLGARIYDLRQNGWHIHSEKVKTKSGKWVAEYYMDIEVVK